MDLLACVIGIGPVAAALRLGQILERYPLAQGVLNLGICGSFDLNLLPLGGIGVASVEIWPEYGLRSAMDESTKVLDLPMLPDLVLDPPNQIDLDPLSAATSMDLALPTTWTLGPSLTVAGVSADDKRARELSQRYHGLMENMEGFALALAARAKGLPFLEIRAVSNQVGSRDKTLWDFNAAFQALGTVLPTVVSE